MAKAEVRGILILSFKYDGILSTTVAVIAPATRIPGFSSKPEYQIATPAIRQAIKHPVLR